MAFLDDVIQRAKDWDVARPRSSQAAVGWSEVGGCRSYLGYRLDEAWASDEPDSWGAIRGTAIHALLEEILAGVPGFRTELTTSYRDIPGHADIVTLDETSVSDWKTTKLRNSRLWQKDEKALWEKRVQVQGYAAGLIEAGELPENAMVRLVVIPVDGTFADWWCWEESFDRSIADWGADRVQDVRERLAAGEFLPKDKPYLYCESWCRFFSLCRAGDDPDASEEIADPELGAAVRAYGETNAKLRVLEKEKEHLADMIRGLRGTAGEWRVGLSKAGEPTPVIDEEKIRATFEQWDMAVPMTTKPGAAPKLSVRRIGKKVAA